MIERHLHIDGIGCCCERVENLVPECNLEAGRLLVADELPADHPQKKVLVDYKTAYEAKLGGSVSTFGGHAYDALHLVAKAAVLGAPTREGIRDGLEKIQGFVGTAGIFNMSDTDHLGLTKDAFEMLTVKNGKFVILKD